MSVRAVILGGTGYGGMELLRLLLGHPHAEVVALTSRTESGPVVDRLPHLRGLTELTYTREEEGTVDALAAEADLVFAALPHGVAATTLPPLLARHAHLRAIDLSGDFRLRDAALYPRWYGFEHPHPEWLSRAVYGLPEVGGRGALATARLVANPGCHASAVLLALWPLVDAGFAADRVQVVGTTGSSGSGAKAQSSTHHPERFANFKAYKPLEHQHLPEIEQALGGRVAVDFVPCSAPLSRGIHVTAFARVGAATEDEVWAAYTARYGAEPLVRLVPTGVEVRAVAGSAFADVSLVVREGTAVATVVIDNLGKGMAGTAVQNLNLLFGLGERTGLAAAGAGL